MFFEIKEASSAKNSRAGSFAKSGNVMRTKLITDAQALNMIKTTPDDDKRRRDNIQVDRSRVDNSVINAAQLQNKAKKNSIALRESEGRAIEAIIEYIGDIDLRPTIENCLRTRRELSTFRDLVRRINKDLREDGSVGVKTINDFSDFYLELKKNATAEEEPEITEQRTILFYAPVDETR